MHIDPYPISALLDRYKLSSKQAVYDRINKLGIKPVARGKISSHQLDQLDKLHEHVDAGGTIDDFVNGSSGIADQPHLTGIPVDNLVDKANNFASFPYPIIIQMQQAPDLLAEYRLLEEVAEKGWLLPTSTVKSLLGRKSLPRLTDGCWFRALGFIFLQTDGRSGRESEWKIKKT